MNIAFGTIISLSTVLSVYILARLALARLSKHETELQFFNAAKARVILDSGAMLITVAVILSGLHTYGPRVKLDSSSSSYQPERLEVESVPDMFESKDRMNVFRDEIENTKDK